ncbi:MAG: hypothetical protein HWN81_01340 [Candidatus Lokiarchaeota archaeon]|nr:hypothetical protein [Candidatus Lokiarchaeota archaeon]
MKKINFRVLICIFIINVFVISFFLVSNGYSTIDEIDSKIGESPVIDGYIDLLDREWNKAAREDIFLEDLPIILRVLQNDENLYISVQFDLSVEYHSLSEYIGLIISNSSSENKEEFIDAKIIQFSNISRNEFVYSDYYIDNGNFLNDTNVDGEGAAKLDEITSTYEFSIPIKTSNISEQDAALDFGNTYAFNITYGETPIYQTGVKKSTTILINIKSTTTSVTPFTDITILIICIVIFSLLGVLYCYFIYKIFRLKRNIKKIKR